MSRLVGPVLVLALGIPGPGCDTERADPLATAGFGLTPSSARFPALGSIPKLCAAPVSDLATLAWKPSPAAPALALSNTCHIGVDRPVHREPGALAWDPVDRQLVLVGGKDISNVGIPYQPPPPILQDTWAYRFGSEPGWTLLADGTGGDKLYPRTASRAWIDAKAHRLVVYGGYYAKKFYKNPFFDPDAKIPEYDSPVYGDVRVLSLDTPESGWMELAFESKPLKRYWPAMVHDPVGNRLLFHGGRDYWGSDVGKETLALDLEVGAEAWSTLDTATKPTGIQERVSSAAIYDSKRHRFILVGGFAVYPGLEAYPDAWALPLEDTESGWIELPFTNEGPGVAFHAWRGFYEPKLDRYYIKGGLAYETEELFDKGWYSVSSRARAVWALIPNDDDTLTWYRLRTQTPNGWTTASPVFWDPAWNLGITSFGAMWGASNAVGSPAWMSNEVRVLLIADPGL